MASSARLFDAGYDDCYYLAESEVPHFQAGSPGLFPGRSNVCPFEVLTGHGTPSLL